MAEYDTADVDFLRQRIAALEKEVLVGSVYRAAVPLMRHRTPQAVAHAIVRSAGGLFDTADVLLYTSVNALPSLSTGHFAETPDHLIRRMVEAINMQDMVQTHRLHDYMQKVIGISIRAEETTIATLIIGVDRFDDGTGAALAEYSHLASIALENALVYAESKENQHFIESINDTLPDIVFIYDYDEDRSIYTNMPLLSALGYTDPGTPHMSGERLRSLIHPDDVPHVVDATRKVARSRPGNVIEVTFRVKHGDGTWHWLWSRNTAFRHDENGRTLQMFGIAQDVTRRKQAEDAVRHSESRLKAIVDAAVQGIAIINDEGFIVESNPALENLLGYTSQEIKTIPAWRYTYQQDLRLENDLTSSLLDGVSDFYHYQKRYIRKDGSTFLGRFTGQMLDDDTGVGMVEDITVQRQNEERIHPRGVKRRDTSAGLHPRHQRKTCDGAGTPRQRTPLPYLDGKCTDHRLHPAKWRTALH